MRLLASVLASFVAALLTAAPAQAELVLAVNEGVTYYVTPAEIREKYKDLAEMLGKQLKTTVRVVPVDQYPVLRKGLDEQQYDLAFVHPAHHSLVSLREREVVLLLLQPLPEDRVLVDRDDSDGRLELFSEQVGQILVLLADLRGRDVVGDAFVDRENELGLCGRRGEQRGDERCEDGGE